MKHIGDDEPPVNPKDRKVGKLELKVDATTAIRNMISQYSEIPPSPRRPSVPGISTTIQPPRAALQAPPPVKQVDGAVSALLAGVLAAVSRERGYEEVLVHEGAVEALVMLCDMSLMADEKNPGGIGAGSSLVLDSADVALSSQVAADARFMPPPPNRIPSQDGSRGGSKMSIASTKSDHTHSSKDSKSDLDATIEKELRRPMQRRVSQVTGHMVDVPPPPSKRRAHAPVRPGDPEADTIPEAGSSATDRGSNGGEKVPNSAAHEQV